MKKLVSLILAITLSFSCLFGCSQVGSPSSSISGAVSSDSNFASKSEMPITLNFIAAKFVETLAMEEYGVSAAQNYNAKLNTAWYTFGETREKLILDKKSGAGEWDITYVDSKWVPEFAQLGLLTPIDDLLKMDGVDASSVNMDDFVDIHLQRQQYDGKTWTLPILAAYVTLAYRTDLFENPEEQKNFKERYGYDLTVPENYDQFMDISEFFTRQKGEMLCGEVLENDFYGTVHSNKKGDFLWHDYINYLVAFGADIIFDPDTMQVTWNSPENVAAATYYKDLMKYQPPENINMAGAEANATFASGYCAMEIEFLNRLASVVDADGSKVSGKVKYALPPSVSGVSGREHAFLVNTNGTGIYAGSKNQVQAFNLLNDILSTEGQKQMALNNVGYIPTRQSVWDDPEVQAAMPTVAEYANLVNEAEPYTFAHPQIPEYPQISDIAQASISNIISGGDVQQCLDDAQAKIEAIMTEAGYYK